MSQIVRYTTNLSKAQGLVPETLELLELWEPTVSAAELKARVKARGALGKPTQVRMEDVVVRGFARRYLTDGGAPARWLKHLVRVRASRALLKQLMFLFTCRANEVLHDFVTGVYWRKVHAGTHDLTREDARDFLERATASGHISPRWADSMMERVARYLIGTLADFELIEKNQAGHRRFRPTALHPGTGVFLAYNLHFADVDSSAIPDNRDWGLFGLNRAEVIRTIDAAAGAGHLFVQHSGPILRIEWKYPDMDAVLDAIAH